MFTVNFLLKNNPNAITMVFKASNAADQLYKQALAANGAEFEAEDDFDCKLRILMSEVVAVTCSEYERDMDKNGDLQIIQHKGQLKTQKKAQNDIGLQMLDKSTNSNIINQ